MELKLSFEEGFKKAGMPLIKLVVNGREGCFLLDTGANVSLIDGEFAKEIGAEEIPSDVEVTTSLLGDSQVSHSYRVALTIDNICFTDVKCIETDLRPANESLKEYGVELHGIIGLSLIYILHGIIDMEDLTLTFRLPKTE
ncbi:MAG: retropepsin-like domain-containing protein [Bacteroidales bacterium]|nr:retropepsin-like domain-containing protein [Bacteroidales bacterium]